MPTAEGQLERCSQCNQVGPLLACDDGDVKSSSAPPGGSKPRFCNRCMIGKKVKVFWPVDNSWYTGTVQEYDAELGEHRLQYADGDTEWVKISSLPSQIPPASGDKNTENDKTAALQQQHPAGDDNQGGGVDSSNEPVPPDVPSGSDPTQPNHPDRSAGAGGAAWNGVDGSSSNMPPYHPAYGGPPPPPHFPPGGFPPGMAPHYAAMSYGMYGSAGAPPGVYGNSPQPPMGYPSGYGMPPMRSVTNKSEDNNSPPDGSGRGRKTGPKPWSKEEDTVLLNLVHSSSWPLKWTVIAESLADRTGKQCRERYVNHLNPRLKSTDWTPLEDATIFHLYNTIGSHWAKMAKVIPGRTDNGIKNRFHNIRRQYEREDTHRMRLSSVQDFPDEIRMDRLRKFPQHLSGKATNLWDMKKAVGVLAAQSVLGSSLNRNQSRFGPFRRAKSDGSDICIRCGLLVPSVQCGLEICTKTGWCQSCARIPPNVTCNLLRECLNLRREGNQELKSIMEDKWEEYFRPDEENAWPYNVQKEQQGKEVKEEAKEEEKTPKVEPPSEEASATNKKEGLVSATI